MFSKFREKRRDRRMARQHRKAHYGEFCTYHNKYEENIPGAPHCFECGHQFMSDQDLLHLDTAIRLQFGDTPLETADEVFTCPLCTHDL